MTMASSIFNMSRSPDYQVTIIPRYLWSHISSAIANMSKLEQKDRYPRIPLEGNSMPSGMGSLMTFKDCHLRAERNPAALAAPTNPRLRACVWPSPSQPATPEKLNQAEIVFSLYGTCNLNILFVPERNFSNS